ncbi:hypothetical protein D3C72_1439470 [compost metagenome]
MSPGALHPGSQQRPARPRRRPGQPLSAADRPAAGGQTRERRIQPDPADPAGARLQPDLSDDQPAAGAAGERRRAQGPAAAAAPQLPLPGAGQPAARQPHLRAAARLRGVQAGGVSALVGLSARALLPRLGQHGAGLEPLRPGGLQPLYGAGLYGAFGDRPLGELHEDSHLRGAPWGGRSRQPDGPAAHTARSAPRTAGAGPAGALVPVLALRAVALDPAHHRRHRRLLRALRVRHPDRQQAAGSQHPLRGQGGQLPQGHHPCRPRPLPVQPGGRDAAKRQHLPLPPADQRAYPGTQPAGTGPAAPFRSGDSAAI